MSKPWLAALVGTALTLFGAGTARAVDIDTDLSVGFDPRWYFGDGRYPGQAQDVNPSLFLQPEFRWQSKRRDHRVTLVGFLRVDDPDENRTHGDLREFYYGYNGRRMDVTVGVNKVFWGVTESRHLVDVINQVDLLEDIDEEDRLGQPMINVDYRFDWGRVGVYALPLFRERRFSGAEGRFRPPVPIDEEQAQFESAAGITHTDWALRYSNYFGAVDVGAYLFRGTSREPRFVAMGGTANAPVLAPVYDQMTQVGLDLQYTTGAWLWKFEGIWRETRADEFAALVAGFEYTFFQVRGAMDLGALVELQYDGRDPRTMFVLADNDLFIGARLAFNDVNDTALLAGVVKDVETGEFFVNIEAERRLTESLFAEVRLRALGGADPGDTSFAFARDDYLQARITWFY